ncbi:class I SAM-dependent methyltransferase [Blastopirellula retiformator]|uniref:Bifunctional 3-demethylubiquinone-9 3-methyltransferase/ 2-octaprenyl-6-hydroxy phenol methylase n=1 Tax=Blastopirellula retiformator TaxID=2527970 RepID=A0A5C5VKH8_9BACT|nr:class I SAM-dependent methyltransferase [Blastopirellula retiformator]TWT38335.1 bifunctional 3-demethylubiquinone-9 3-methyltransferase/ 2-octaprenyl-6-hydroxy phenol methylase [Blastopirellula retiformator]
MSTDQDPPESHSQTLDHNRTAWDRKVQQRDRFARPAKDEDFRDPLALVDRWGWLGGSVVGKRILCLGAGGGRQGPLYAAAGGIVTVVDISPAQLELDRQVAAERKLALTTVEASMDDLSMLGTADFDVVINPVSTCYLPDLRSVYAEVARLLADGGTYISQHKTPTSLQTDIRRSPGGYELIEPYYRRGPLPAVAGSRHREEGTLEYLHRWEELIGLMCRNGFVIEDLVEPMHAKEDAEADSFADRSRYVAPYVRIKARRVGQAAQQESRGAIWLPGS